MEQARIHAIRAHPKGIQVPAGLDEPQKVLAGADHFAAHCAVCHGAPGVPEGDIALGLYPAPPDLASAAIAYSADYAGLVMENMAKGGHHHHHD